MKRITVVSDDPKLKEEWINQTMSKANFPVHVRYPEPVKFSSETDLVLLTGIPDEKIIKWLIDTCAHVNGTVSFIFELRKGVTTEIEKSDNVRVLCLKRMDQKKAETETETDAEWDVVRFIRDRNLDFLSGMALMAIIDGEIALAIDFLKTKLSVSEK